tara:strand:- start:662 stop:865 length:204 start_codon:yes stop_codon:yes gene_type:complete
MNELKYIRDDTSSAVLNTDKVALNRYKINRKIKLEEQKKLQDCITDINTLKDDMQEIKNLLLKMSEK